jgi:hypothetical protein
MPQDDVAPERPDVPGPSALTGTQGSGDLSLEVEITKMRSAILRTVTELDRFCESVRRAREQVEQIRDRVAQESEHQE